jgi:hypothetical protein
VFISSACVTADDRDPPNAQLCGLALIIVGGISLGNVFDFFSSKNLGIGACRRGGRRAPLGRERTCAERVCICAWTGLIILGALAFIVSLLGCLGALRTNRGLLKVVRRRSRARTWSGPAWC